MPRYDATQSGLIQIQHWHRRVSRDGLAVRTFQSLIYSISDLMASGKAAELQTACAFNICLKCKVVRDDEWQRQSWVLIMYGKKNPKLNFD